MSSKLHLRLPKPANSTEKRYLKDDNIDELMSAPVISYCEESNSFSIYHPMACYEDLTRSIAQAIAEAHCLLGWDLEYEQLLDYLEKHYPHDFTN